MNIKVKVNNNIKKYEIDDNFKNKLDILFKLLESSLKIDKKYFFLQHNEKEVELDSQLEEDIILDLEFRFSFFQGKLVEFEFNNETFHFPLETLKESNVINILILDNEEDNNDLIAFKNRNFATTKCIENWLNLSFEIDSFLSFHNKTNIDLKIPKPLPNKKLSEFIGENAYCYLDNLSKDELEALATLSDYLDIPYLLETSCAFIAEKYVKKCSIKELKDFFEGVN